MDDTQTLQSNPFEIIIELDEFKELEKDNSLRFSVVYKTSAGREVIRIPGWRVKQKRVLIPARYVPKMGWVPTVTPSERFTALLELMVIPLAPSFPSIEFPDDTQVSETEQS